KLCWRAARDYNAPRLIHHILPDGSRVRLPLRSIIGIDSLVGAHGEPRARRQNGPIASWLAILGSFVIVTVRAARHRREIQRLDLVHIEAPAYAAVVLKNDALTGAADEAAINGRAVAQCEARGKNRDW